jgi:four helix bundle protein
MRIKRFEEIKAWQEARMLVKMIYSSIDRNRGFQYDLKFKSQITSSAVSTMSNIAEGFSKNSNKEFVRFLFIAKGSLAELQSLLYVALDLNYINNEIYIKISEQSELTARYISKFISYLKFTTKK